MTETGRGGRFGSPTTTESRARAIESALSSVEPYRRAAVEIIMAGIPVSLRKQYLRTVTGKASRGLAIKMHCIECMGWTREDVAGCTALGCPLYDQRPRSRAKRATADVRDGEGGQ